MGHVEKALLPFSAGTLLDAVIERVHPQVDALALKVRQEAAHHYQAWADQGMPLLPDSLPGGIGPLAGVVAGLEWAAELGSNWLATFPADTPFLPLTLVAALAAQARSDAVAPIVALDGERTQSLCALGPIACRMRLRSGVEKGEFRSVKRALLSLGAVLCPMPDAGHAFLNINTPEDLRMAEALLADPR